MGNKEMKNGRLKCKFCDLDAATVLPAHDDGPPLILCEFHYNDLFYRTTRRMSRAGIIEQSGTNVKLSKKYRRLCPKPDRKKTEGTG